MSMASYTLNMLGPFHRSITQATRNNRRFLKSQIMLISVKRRALYYSLYLRTSVEKCFRIKQFVTVDTSGKIEVLNLEDFQFVSKVQDQSDFGQSQHAKNARALNGAVRSMKARKKTEIFRFPSVLFKGYFREQVRRIKQNWPNQEIPLSCQNLYSTRCHYWHEI